jgi:hypothetical protein
MIEQDALSVEEAARIGGIGRTNCTAKLLMVARCLLRPHPHEIRGGPLQPLS